MKTKYDSNLYLQSFAQNDIQMVEKIKGTMNMKAILISCLWYSISIFVIFDLCNAFYVKLLFLSFSILLILLTYLSLMQYNRNMILKLLIKNYLIRAFLGIFGATMNVIAITLLFSNNSNSEMWIAFVSCLSMITLTFSYLINSKYMEIKNSETLAIMTITGGCLSYLIVRNLDNFMICILTIIILIIIVSSLSEHIIRSIRLLKYAPKDLLEHTELTE